MASGDVRGRSLPTLPEVVAAVLTGGASSAAFQAGALARLSRQGIALDMVTGAGFGAINAAIMAGNHSGRQASSLRAFWMSGLPEEVMQGRAFKEDSADAGELRHALDEVVDWDLVNDGPMRCSIVIESDSDGSYQIADNSQTRLDGRSVIEAIRSRATARGASRQTENLETIALRVAVEALTGPSLLLEIGLPSVSLDSAASERVPWVGQIAFVSVPDHRDSAYRMSRSFDPAELWHAGAENIAKRFKNADMLAANIESGRSAAFDLALGPLDPGERTVSFLYATSRARNTSESGVEYSGERDHLHYGSAQVRIPEQRAIGSVALPFSLKVFGYELSRKADPQKHFTLKSIEELSYEDWCGTARALGADEALVFVHGFNVKFLESVYRFAQIIWDIRYEGLPVLFSWASRGGLRNYEYDRNSALVARTPFADLLSNLGETGVRRVHVIAHSMGNLVVLDALAHHNHLEHPLGIGELIMAAPDVDADQYYDLAPKVRAVTKGMTLYASAADKALAASKGLAGFIQRAGDITDGKPLLVDRVDSIDVTAIGDDLLGLNHGVFATNTSILNDVRILLSTGERPPTKRLIELTGMPDQHAPAWWQFRV